MILIERSDFPMLVTVSWPSLPRGGGVIEKWREEFQAYLKKEFPEGFVWKHDGLMVNDEACVQFRLKTEEDAVLFKMKYRYGVEYD